MKTRIIVCFILAAFHECCPGQTNTNAAAVNDPMFQGKPLSAWMEAGYKSENKSGPEWQAADGAVYNLGTNAVPLLLQWLAAKDSPTNHFDAEFRNKAAEAGFGSLAAIEANTHAPMFDLRYAAAAVVDIYRQNISLSSRSAACAILYYLGGAIDPAAKSVIPQLCVDATNQETLIGHDALMALSNIRSEAAVVAPYLAKVLHDCGDTDFTIQMGAMEALGNLGTNARSAIPALRGFAKRPNIMFGDMAAEAIKKIDPDGTAPAGPDLNTSQPKAGDAADAATEVDWKKSGHNYIVVSNVIVDLHTEATPLPHPAGAPEIDDSKTYLHVMHVGVGHGESDRVKGMQGLIYMATDWSTPRLARTNLVDIVSTEDKTKIVVMVLDNGPIYSSTNAGMTWTVINTPGKHEFPLTATPDVGGFFATATVSPSPINQPALNSPATNWYAVGSAPDGSQLVMSADVSQPAPAMNITHLGGRVVVSWPAASTGFVLQENSNLFNPNWVDVPDAVTQAGDKNQVLVSRPDANNFYRLKSK